jgi:hypothetical protein
MSILLRIEKRMLLISSHHPERRCRSRPRSAAQAAEAKRRALTDTGAEGTGSHDGECFVNFYYGSGLFPLFASLSSKSVADIHERSIVSERLMAFRLPR